MPGIDVQIWRRESDRRATVILTRHPKICDWILLGIVSRHVAASQLSPDPLDFGWGKTCGKSPGRVPSRRCRHA